MKSRKRDQRTEDFCFIDIKYVFTGFNAASVSSLASEEAVCRAALPDRDRQEVHRDVRHRHRVQAAKRGGPGLALGGLRSLLQPVGFVGRPQPISPALRLAWTRAPAGGGGEPPRMPRLPPGFRCDGGLLLEPPGQLEEALVRRLPVTERGLFARAVPRLVKELRLAPPLSGEPRVLLVQGGRCWGGSGPPLRLWCAHGNTFPPVDRARREDGGNHGA